MSAFIVASLPGPGLRNPYVDLFYEALRSHGVEIYAEPIIDIAWGQTHFSAIDALHFHWPEYIWRSRPPRRAGPLQRFARGHVPGAWRVLDVLERRAAGPKAPTAVGRAWTKWRGLRRFRAFLDSARDAGVAIVWTLHNLQSHEEWDLFDRIGFGVLARRASMVICHGGFAREAFHARYGDKVPAVVMPHGNYDGVYPAPRPRAAVLAELGLDPTRPIVGCVGAIRAYKGIDVACDAVRRLDGRVQLLCAGALHPSFPRERVEQASRDIPGAALVPRPLTDQEFADLCSACDALLLPYRQITGSGALLAALTLGRAVVASDLPYFREILADHPQAGQLVRVGDAQAVADAIERLLLVPQQERERAARQLAAQFAWPTVVLPVAAAMRDLGSRRAGTTGAPKLTPPISGPLK